MSLAPFLNNWQAVGIGNLVLTVHTLTLYIILFGHDVIYCKEVRHP